MMGPGERVGLGVAGSVLVVGDATPDVVRTASDHHPILISLD